MLSGRRRKTFFRKRSCRAAPPLAQKGRDVTEYPITAAAATRRRRDHRNEPIVSNDEASNRFVIVNKADRVMVSSMVRKRAIASRISDKN